MLCNVTFSWFPNTCENTKKELKTIFISLLISQERPGLYLAFFVFILDSLTDFLPLFLLLFFLTIWLVDGLLVSFLAFKLPWDGLVLTLGLLLFLLSLGLLRHCWRLLALFDFRSVKVSRLIFKLKSWLRSSQVRVTI